MGSKAKKLASKIIEDLLNHTEDGEEKVESENTSKIRKEKRELLKDSKENISSQRSFSEEAQPVESLLGISQNLRLAQGKISNLEKQLEDLTRENFNLLTAGQVFQNKSEELSEEMESMKSHYERTKEEFRSEKKKLHGLLDKNKKEADESKKKVYAMEELVASKIQKIRYREQDLENRIEIMKKEADVLLRSKNKMILDLKREIRSINKILDGYKTKGNELNLKLRNKENVLQKSVKALHLALSLLEQS